MAYQISFDLEENATQEFLSKVSAELPVEPETEMSESTTEGEQQKVKNIATVTLVLNAKSSFLA
jgi:26S proteasome regulatory subunit N2